MEGNAGGQGQPSIREGGGGRENWEAVDDLDAISREREKESRIGGLVVYVLICALHPRYSTKCIARIGGQSLRLKLWQT